jgi:hypothetical protein
MYKEREAEGDGGMVRIERIALCIEKMCEVDKLRADSVEISAFDVEGNLRLGRAVVIDLRRETPSAAEIYRRSVEGGLRVADLFEVRALRDGLVVRRHQFGLMASESARRLEHERGAGRLAT